MSMSGGANLGTATFYITGNAQGASNAAAQANNALAQLGQTVANNWWGIQNLGVAFAALPSAVLAGTGAAINAAVEWQDALFELQRATGGTAESAKEIGDEILDVARKVPLATAQLADLAATAATLGVDNVTKFAQIFGTLISVTDLTEANVADFARVINVMQVPEAQFEQFSNTLIEVGRNTAATESEILNISKRMSGAAAVAGLTADELLSLGAAVISLGPAANAGATAMSRTIQDMTRAVSEGGDELSLFADVAQMSVDDFSTLFREDAVKAIAAFVTGLARLQGGGEDQLRVLTALGITEQRQIAALQQLAQGTLDVGNEQRDLNAIIEFGASSWQNSNATQDLAAQRAKTLSGQLQLLRNAMFEFGQSVGQFFVGPLGFFVQRILDFLAGVQALPAPLKILMAAMLLLLTAMTGLAAVVFLIGPRLLIAYDAFQRMRGGVTQLTPQIEGLGASFLRTGQQAAVMGAQIQNASREAIIASNNARIAAQGAASGYATMQANLAGLAGTLAVSSRTATAEMGTMVTWGTRMAKVGGWIALAMTAMSIATTFLGNRQRQQQEQADAALQANEDLVSIMRQQGAQIGDASIAWLQTTEQYQRATVAAQGLGISLDLLNRIITGQATPQDMDSFVTTIRDGDQAAKDMGRDVLALGTIWQNSAGRSGVAAGAVADYTDALGLSEEAAQDNNEALKEQIKLLTQIAQAHIDLADAVLSQQQAQLDLADAQDQYREAMQDAQDPTLAMRRAELELAQARFDAADADRELRERELDLAEARQKGLRRAHDAELDLADAQDRYRDSLQTIADLEEKVAELREGPSADELRDATNDLRNAELKLARAHQDVSDAEWYLQHLREEGASNRDIEDAELALAEARQDVADSEDDVADTTKKLNDLRSGEERARDLADAENDLQRAYRDSERALEDITDKQNALEDARQRVAEDRDYLDAQAAIVEAQQRVLEATNDVRDAELELEELRAGRAERDQARAALELEAAIIKMAQANVEVRRQQALANGETWDAGDAAHALADEISALMGLSPDAATTSRLQDYIDTLRAAPNIPDAPAETNPSVEFDPTDYGLPNMSDVQGYLDELQDLVGQQGVGGPSLWENIFAGVGPLLAVLLGPKLLAGIGSAFTWVAEAVAVGGGAMFAAVGAIIAAFIGFCVFWFSDPQRRRDFLKGLDVIWDWIFEFVSNIPSRLGGLWDDFVRVGGDIIGGLWRGITAAGAAILHGIGNWLYSTFVQPFKDLFQISSPSRLFMQIGMDVIQGLWNGMVAIASAAWNWIRNLPSTIINVFSNAWSWLFNAGKDIIQGLWNGIQNIWSSTALWLSTTWARVSGFFSNAASWLFNAGKAILQGLWDGMVNIWNSVTGWLGGLGGRIVDLKGPPSTDAKLLVGNGQLIMMGLRKGMEDEWENLSQWLSTLGDQMQVDGDPFAGSMMDGLKNAGLTRDYIQGLVSDLSGAQLDFATSLPSLQAGQTGQTVNNYYDETLNLDAITTADPTEIVNEYVWAKRVRMRGA